MKEIKDSSIFFELQEKFKRIPFTQSQGWYNYIKAQGKEPVFFVDNEQDPNIFCWGTIQNIPFSKKTILRLDGETYKPELTEKVFKCFYSELTKIHDAIEINSNNPYNIEFETGIRRAGFKRPIGFFSCPLTIEMDFKVDFNFDRNWKRNVKKSVKNNLQFVEIQNISNEVLIHIIGMFDELATLKNLGYRIEKKPLGSLLESKDMRTFVVYDESMNPVAARIIQDNKPFSTDVFAANSLKARDCGATFFIMQSIFEKLKGEQYLNFDFGRIPPSNHATDSVYVFKNASRGNKIQYNGEWTFYKNTKIELAVFLYKSFKIKKQRY